MTTTRDMWFMEYKLYLQSQQWKNIKYTIEALSGNRCVLFPWLSAKNVHHMHYKNIKDQYIPIGNGTYKYIFTALRDMPVRDVVPLSRIGHQLVHKKWLWKNKKIRRIVNCYLRFAFVMCMIVFRKNIKHTGPISHKYISTFIK